MLITNRSEFDEMLNAVSRSKEGSAFLIPLIPDQFAIIDELDLDLAEFTWRAKFCPNYANGGKYRAQRGYQKEGKKGTILMHRVILARVVGRDLERNELVDHANGEPLDNRRENLRVATQRENSQNSRKRKDNQSGYKGVYWMQERRKYAAQITYNNNQMYLGLFDDPVEAAKAYDTKARELFGEFALTNFGV